MKDWTGNRTSLFAALGSSNHTTAQREHNDYYATDPRALTCLMKHLPPPERIYECACGEGHLSEELIRHGHEVISTDLINRGYGVGDVDFLKIPCMPEGYKCILTNPPYKYTTEFIEHALDILPEGGMAIFLLNVNILAGKARFQRIYSRGVLRELFLFSSRVQCAKNGNFAACKSSAVNYAWFVFEKGYCGSTLLHWI